MVDFHFVTIHPEFIRSYFEFGVFRSAVEKKKASYSVLNLRDFAVDHRGSIDDKPFGGGDGMIMRPEPLAEAVKSLGDKNPYVIFTSPRGRVFNQERANQLALLDRPLLFVCGRFGGVDQRFIDIYVDEEISLGEFVISGGELPALTIGDAILRQVPGVLGNSDSAVFDSFSPAYDGKKEGPQYTRPVEFEGVRVPEVLISGDHQAIAHWRRKHLT